jgi:hypothetical protein
MILMIIMVILLIFTYGGQPELLHYKFDMLDFVKNDKIMYLRMINECIEYLRLYSQL